tara:strand:- start:71920 stop:72213 length:294 start_codon:yes stop_codon:yes gene_type:complete
MNTDYVGVVTISESSYIFIGNCPPLHRYLSLIGGDPEYANEHPTFSALSCCLENVKSFCELQGVLLFRIKDYGFSSWIQDYLECIKNNIHLNKQHQL